MARVRGIRRIPSGGEAGLSVEPTPALAPPRASAARIAAAGALAGAVVLLFDGIFAPRETHMGPVRVLTTFLRDAFGRAIPLEGLVVVLLDFAISAVYAAILAQIVVHMVLRQAVTFGALFGLLLYAWHFYGLAPFASWIADGRDALNLAGHVLFGVIVALTVRSPRVP